MINVIAKLRRQLSIGLDSTIPEREIDVFPLIELPRVLPSNVPTVVRGRGTDAAEEVIVVELNTLTTFLSSNLVFVMNVKVLVQIHARKCIVY